MSKEPDVPLTAGLNLTALKRDLGLLSTAITKTTTEIADRNQKIAALQIKIANGVTANQLANLNKQIANMTGFVNTSQQKLNLLNNQYKQFYSAIANYAQNAAKAQNAAAGGVGGPGGGGGGGLFGRRSPLGSALISGGFALRGVPGLGALSSLGIGAGFGGQFGVAGAAIGLGIAEAAAGIKSLIGLYEDLGKAAYDLWQNHDRLKASFDDTGQTIAQHFYPALKEIQDLELKIAEFLNKHDNDIVAPIADDFSRIAISGKEFVTSMLLFVTNSDMIDQALAKVGATAKMATGYVAGNLNYWGALLTRPMDVLLTPARQGIQSALYGSNQSDRSPVASPKDYQDSIDFAYRKIAELPSPDLKDRAQIDKIQETIKKRKEEIVALQETAKLDEYLALIEKQREGGLISQLQALHGQLAVKETIAMNELQARKREEQDAIKFKNSRGSALEQAQADNKLQEAVAARVKAENTLTTTRINNSREEADALIKERDRINAANEKAFKTVQERTLQRISRIGPPDQYVGIPGGELGLAQRSAERRRAELEGQVGYQQGLIKVAESQYDNLGSTADRKAQLEGIDALKRKESDYNDELIKTIQLLMTLNGDPTSDAYKKLSDALDKAVEGTTKLQKVTLSTGDMLRSTFEIIIQHASAFNNVIGTAAGRAAILGKSILDLSKITIGNTDKPSGSILGGLKEGFSTKAKAFTQGIPEVAAIASAAVGVITALHDLFTRASKAIAESIGKEVDDIVSSTRDSGKIADGLAKLEIERLRALSELSDKKGGQKQLDTLLPTIQKQMDELKKQQAEIADTFNDTLDKLRMGAPFDSMFDSIHAAQKQIKEFIDSVGDVDSEFAKVQEFMDLTYSKMSTDWQKRWDDAWKTWGQGAENAAGELISIDQEAVSEIDTENSNYDKAETQRTKDLADLKKNYSKQQADDIKKLSQLQQDLNDLNDQETKGILSIQNEGIQERQKTTEDDKRQRIADLQDATSKQRQSITDQINDLEDVRAEREISYNEALQQATDEEAQAEQNHQNTISRIINETDRKRAAFLENLDNLKKEKDFIDSMQQDSSAWLKGYIDSFKQLPGGTVFVDQITINLSNPNLTADEIARAVRDGLDNVAQRIPLT